MLKLLKVSGFKSIRSLDLNLENFTVFFGPNSVGKSNILDAIQTLSRLATERTIHDALDGPIRGNPIEVFSFEADGLTGLLNKSSASFSLEAEIERAERTRQPYRYGARIEIEPSTGRLSLREEHLDTLNRSNREPKGTPRIKTEGDLLSMPSGQGRPKTEKLPLNHTVLSDERYGGTQYSAIEQCRKELAGWEIYYFDPREAMRRSSPPSQVNNIGQLGENLSAFLYRLKNEEPGRFEALRRTLAAVIPSIKSIDVLLDGRRGTLEIMVTQSGIEYSARVMSEGTLRVLALCAIALNPWGGSLIAIEEPENGVHPQRVELIADLLMTASSNKKQIVVTSHSPIFCAAAVAAARQSNGEKALALYGVGNGSNTTTASPVDLKGPLFERNEFLELLKSNDDSARIGALIMNGALNAA